MAKKTVRRAARKSPPKKKATRSTKTKKPAAGRKSSRNPKVRRAVVVGRRQEKRPARLITAERNPAAVKMYEGALKNFTRHEFARAREAFQRVIDQFPKETDIAERSRVHLRICQQQLARNAGAGKSAEDYYNLAIAHLNRREFKEAEASLEKALSMQPKGDYIHYGLAALEALQGHAEPALKHLQHAIQLNPQNRMTAHRDTDFETLAHHPEFQALLRPATDEPRFS